MLATEDPPTWLKLWKTRRPFSVDDFFASRVVYYPGSGTDGQPVQVFGSRHLAHCFVFVDYGITKSHIESELSVAGHPFAGYRSIGRIELTEQEIAPSGWLHVSPEEAQLRPCELVPPYAFIEILERGQDLDDLHGPRRLAILFLCADGIAAYDGLFSQAHRNAPLVVVLQDHGFGGNWSTFGGEGALEQAATRAGRLPKYLLVAENTKAWSGYTPIDGTVFSGGGMHRFNRQVWRHTDAETQSTYRDVDSRLKAT